MMKPKFDDVLDYVRGDETDRAMTEMLRMHPDGPELLKQARFIIAAMGGRPKSDIAKSPAAFDLDDLMPASRAPEADNLSMPDPAVFDALEEPLASATYYQEKPSRKRRSKPTIRQRLLRNADRGTEDLGTLNLTTRRDETGITYNPSESVIRRYGKPLLLGLAKQRSIEGTDGINIRGAQLALSLSETAAAGEAISIRVSRSLKKQPARYMEVIFMPETGPFVQIQTDAEGVAELPVPEMDGTLRIEGPTPHLLHIKLEK